MKLKNIYTTPQNANNVPDLMSAIQKSFDAICNDPTKKRLIPLIQSGFSLCGKNSFDDLTIVCQLAILIPEVFDNELKVSLPKAFKLAKKYEDFWRLGCIICSPKGSLNHTPLLTQIAKKMKGFPMVNSLMMLQTCYFLKVVKMEKEAKEMACKLEKKAKSSIGLAQTAMALKMFKGFDEKAEKAAKAALELAKTREDFDWVIMSLGVCHLDKEIDKAVNIMNSL